MRTILFSLAMLAIAAPALAQPSFGVKAGLNVADIFVDTGDDFDFDNELRLGVVAGATVDVPLSPTLGARIEALYAQKGYRLETRFTDANTPDPTFIEGSLTVKLDYLEVPVLLNVMVPMQSGLEIGVQAGVVPAFLINDGIGCSGFDASEVDICADIDDENEDLGFDSFDLGAAAGATVGAGPFAVDLRYTYGLIDIQDDDDFNVGQTTVRNGVFSVTGVYRFGR